VHPVAVEQTRKRLEALAGEPAALSAWIEELIEASDRRLPEVAGWAVEQRNVELLMALMDDYVVHCEMRTVEVIRKALAPTSLTRWVVAWSARRSTRRRRRCGC